MDNLSDLDDCINTLEQLQLALDFEIPTAQCNSKSNTSLFSHGNVKYSPLSQNCVNPLSSSLTYTNSSLVPVSHLDPKQISDNDSSMKDTTKPAVHKIEKHKVFMEEPRRHKSQIEMSDFQSVSARRQKLISNKSADFDLFSVPEGDGTDFPPPPPLLNDDNDIFLKEYSTQTLQRQRPSSKSVSPFSTSHMSYNTTPRKQSFNSLKSFYRPLLNPDSTAPSKSNKDFTSESLTQSNISNYTNTVVRFFTTDKTTKAIAVTEDMTVEQIIRILMEKHFWTPSLKSTVVEKVPSLKMERFLEENEYLLSCINSWRSTCGNMIFFEPREDVYGLFENPKMYLGGNHPPGSINVDDIKNLFCSVYNEQHEYQDYLYIKKPEENAWKRKFCLVNHHGIFSTQKNKSKSLSLFTVMAFNDRFYLYTSTGGWHKQWEAPTPFGFGFKPYNVADPLSDEIIMFCAGDEVSMKRWCSNLRLCKYKNQILNNYQLRQNRSVFCSNLYSSDCHINRQLSMSPSATLKSSKYNFSTRSSLPTDSLYYNKSGSSMFKF